MSTNQLTIKPILFLTPRIKGVLSELRPHTQTHSEFLLGVKRWDKDRDRGREAENSGPTFETFRKLVGRSNLNSGHRRLKKKNTSVCKTVWQF